MSETIRSTGSIASETSALTGSPRSGAGARIVGSGASDSSGPGPQVMASSTLEGNDVVNRQGDKLGDIEEIMLDVPSGQIAYAVLAAGGFLGMGEKFFAIPWQALTLDTDNKCFILDIDKERMERAPGFDKDHWPSMADTTWARDIHSYYGATPYWE